MYNRILLCSVDPARAEVDERAKPRALVDAATNTVSSLKDGDLEACCIEQPGRSKPAYASSDDADLPRPTLKIGMHTGYLRRLHNSLNGRTRVF